MGNFKWDMELLKKVFAEFTGTAMVLALGCTVDGTPDAMKSLVWGLIYLAAIHIFAFMSGAHLNPAVSAAATIVGVMEWQLMLCYMLAQLLGAFCGAGMAFGAQPNGAKQFCATVPILKDYLYLVVELLAMMLLMFAYCAIWDKRSDNAYDTMSLRIGFTIAALSFATINLGGCSLNFFRSLAPACISQQFNGLWVYFVAHLLAAVLVPVLWRFLIAEEKPEPADG
ncbi:probable aquaporin NIP-type [Drosophila novamexicana]|uniref:probable aquaporin NIP-type n=1 Tax=Drosophila novamexicana TaxID=47314 RepID=UPI0011E5FC7C|nr:probable aquaporin NIP-type [Drosophila novamexicana]